MADKWSILLYQAIFWNSLNMKIRDTYTVSTDFCVTGIFHFMEVSLIIINNIANLERKRFFPCVIDSGSLVNKKKFADRFMTVQRA